MKILIVNTLDNGGAATACKRLHYGLLPKGVSSQVLLKIKQSNWVKSTVFVPIRNKITTFYLLKKAVVLLLKKMKLYKNKQHEFIRQRKKGLELFSFPNSDCDITDCNLYKESDVINLHWVTDFLDFKTFFEVNKKPVVWTLHDMNPFTGGEHYLESFLGINDLGFPIVRKLTEEEITVANNNLKLKKEIISKISNLTVVAPSKWLLNEAQNSELFRGLKIHHIPNGINTSVFSPREKKYSRELLNLPQDKIIILFVAESISSNRKGFEYLKRAFNKIQDSNLILCAIGSKIFDIPASHNFFELGPIQDELLMSVAYSAVDVFVIPSVMDNLPNTVIESLVCGTPVIGFPVGGIKDMIEEGVNGLLTDDVSVDSLVITLKKFISNPYFFNSHQIRKNAVESYDESIQSKRYIDLFTEILV
jgi:glycosyltransferase involved in cell wall biosynthesis